jgi:hypothetical protein
MKIWVLIFILLSSALSIWHFLVGSLDEMSCRMTWMWPDYIKYPFRSKYNHNYSLWLFKNRGHLDDGTKLVNLPYNLISNMHLSNLTINSNIFSLKEYQSYLYRVMREVVIR